MVYSPHIKWPPPSIPIFIKANHISCYLFIGLFSLQSGILQIEQHHRVYLHTPFPILLKYFVRTKQVELQAVPTLLSSLLYFTGGGRVSFPSLPFILSKIWILGTLPLECFIWRCSCCLRFWSSRLLQRISLNFRITNSKFISSLISLSWELIMFMYHMCILTTFIPKIVVKRVKQQSLVNHLCLKFRIFCLCLLCSSTSGRYL